MFAILLVLMSTIVGNVLKKEMNYFSSESNFIFFIVPLEFTVAVTS